MFRLCLSNRKKMRKSATDIGELGDLKVSFCARYPTGRLRTQETGAIREVTNPNNLRQPNVPGGLVFSGIISGL